jgi:hypothetical protein
MRPTTAAEEKEKEKEKEKIEAASNKMPHLTSQD